MRKIMLVIDDFNELEFLESLLRRLSFDVLSLSKDLSVPSAILGFFPDLVMAQAKSRAVDGVVLSQKVRKLAPQARMVLLHPIGQPPKAGAELKQTVDAFLEIPVDPAKLIAMLSQLGSLDEKVLQDKLNRIAAGKMSEEKRTRLQGKSGLGQQQSQNTMVSGANSAKANQSDMVHVTSKNPGAGQQSSGVAGSGTSRETSSHTMVTGGNGNQPTMPGMKTGAQESATGDGLSKGVHHFSGNNTLKGATHFSGEAQKTGAAYDPTGNQASGMPGGGTYVPTPGENGSSKSASTGSQRSSAATAEVSTRTKRYDEFLASHDEPVDKVIPQGEMKKRAKLYKLDVAKSEEDINQKREFVRALFRK